MRVVGSAINVANYRVNEELPCYGKRLTRSIPHLLFARMEHSPKQAVSITIGPKQMAAIPGPERASDPYGPEAAQTPIANAHAPTMTKNMFNVSIMHGAFWIQQLSAELAASPVCYPPRSSRLSFQARSLDRRRAEKADSFFSLEVCPFTRGDT